VSFVPAFVWILLMSTTQPQSEMFIAAFHSEGAVSGWSPEDFLVLAKRLAGPPGVGLRHTGRSVMAANHLYTMKPIETRSLSRRRDTNGLVVPLENTETAFRFRLQTLAAWAIRESCLPV
jgi:hypothetical protein